MKTCSKCKIEKKLEEFPRKYKNSDARSSYCQDCANEIRKNWRKNNPEKDKALRQRYESSNKGKENRKLYLKRNPEQRKAALSKYYKSDKGKASINRWRKKQGNESDFSIRIKNWRKGHYASNRDKYLKNQKNRSKAYNARIINNIEDVYIKSKLKQQGFPSDKITGEVIEIKRLMLKTKREIIKHENKNHNPARRNSGIE